MKDRENGVRRGKVEKVWEELGERVGSDQWVDAERGEAAVELSKGKGSEKFLVFTVGFGSVGEEPSSVSSLESKVIVAFI